MQNGQIIFRFLFFNYLFLPVLPSRDRFHFTCIASFFTNIYLLCTIYRLLNQPPLDCTVARFTNSNRSVFKIYFKFYIWHAIECSRVGWICQSIRNTYIYHLYHVYSNTYERCVQLPALLHLTFIFVFNTSQCS